MKSVLATPRSTLKVYDIPPAVTVYEAQQMTSEPKNEAQQKRNKIEERGV